MSDDRDDRDDRYDDRYDDGGGDDERRRQIALRVGGVIVGIAVIVLIGARVMVSALDLNEDTSQPTSGPASAPTPISSPSEESTPSSGEPSDLPTRSAGAHGKLQLSVAPVIVQANDRINFTGRYPGQDAVTLQVQRFDGGSWSDFPVSARVTVGTFSTYIITGRHGDQRFRVIDKQAHVASNPVRVTVD